MKTAISVNDRLLADADQTAKEMGVSRSRLFSIALESYLRDRLRERMLEQINRVYGGDDEQTARAERETTIDMKARFRKVVKDSW